MKPTRNFYCHVHGSVPYWLGGYSHDEVARWTGAERKGERGNKAGSTLRLHTRHLPPLKCCRVKTATNQNAAIVRSNHDTNCSVLIGRLLKSLFIAYE